MVRHERIAHHVYLEQDEVLAQKLKIEFAIAIGKEHPLALIAALGDMVRASWYDDSSNPWHQ